MKRVLYILLGILTAASCYRFDPSEAYYTDGPIWPDYMDVTVPVGIAPLNFCYTAADGPVPVTTFSHGDMNISIKGREVVWKDREWKKLLEAAKGDDIIVKSSVLPDPWTIHVSEDDIDYGINYRLIAPGYEVYSKMGIHERELSSYKEKALLENTQFDGCVNCHAYNRGNPDNYSLHIRGSHGATLLNLDGEMAAYNTQTDSTLGFCVYPYWHPGGDYIAYSSNSTRQGFHVLADKLIEVFDLDSDLQVYDVRNNSLITSASVKKENVWETFPAFSADGRKLFFCAATPRPIPAEVEEIRYNLCSVDFDPATGSIGSRIDTLIFAEGMGRSVSFPKPSYDGRFLVYTLSDYGNFSIWHHEADLWILDLETGESRPMDKANSHDTESYHSWSSNSRWLMFSSRRDDGLYTRLFFTHIDENGQESKPFMLPQKHPLHYYSYQNRSYNVPEFVTGPVELDRAGAEKMINSSERVQFGFRWSE
ncbi:MAG: PD40 domain-containing protein [Bacteroidales bacterium]|nr:PD40 domain-containing protein [Bacteroidales bacterium]